MNEMLRIFNCHITPSALANLMHVEYIGIVIVFSRRATDDNRAIASYAHRISKKSTVAVL
jgi:hypothetical protein